MRKNEDELEHGEVDASVEVALDVDEGRGAARARTLLHMKSLLAGATASIAIAGCSSRDGASLDAGVASASTIPGPSSSAVGSASTLASAPSPVPPPTSSASAAPSASASAEIRDAGTPHPPKPVVAHPPRPSGYEVVDMLPPPPMLLILRRRKKKPKKENPA